MTACFLVATTHRLLLLDLHAQRLLEVDNEHGLYYGICRHEGSVYVACRNGVHGPDQDDARKNERGSVLVFDSALRLRSELQPGFPMRDVHGIAAIDDQIWITCSYDNMIAIYDLRNEEWRRWYPSVNPATRGMDVNHFNSIAMVEGRLCLLAHNFGLSQLLFYDYPSLHLESVLSLGVQAHDIFRLEGKLATCSSAEGVLVSVDGSRIRTGGFPRGFSMTNSEILVGVSMVAARSQRHAMSGIVRHYNPQWDFQTDYVLENAGMILAIESLPDCNPAQLPASPHVRKFSSGYNDVAPGNVYKPGESDANLFLPEWHAAEPDGRWTAAKSARMTIVRNPGENRLTIEAASWYPGPFHVEIWIDDVFLGPIDFEGPGSRKCSFAFLMPARRAGNLIFRLPHPWRPKDVLSMSEDERLLGLFVVAVVAETTI